MLIDFLLICIIREYFLNSISAVLQARICEDVGKSSIHRKKSNFDINPIIESKLPASVYDSTLIVEETQNDTALHSLIKSGEVPSIFELIEYITFIYNAVGYSAECNIIALIYTNRVLSTSSMCLTNSNWRALWTTSILLVQKVS